MKNTFKPLLAIAMLMIVFISCEKKEYSFGDLTAPSNLQINTVIVGQDAANPNGDGSGDVEITVTADNAIAYKVDFDANSPVDLVFLPTGTITHKYTTEGVNNYTITAVVYGKGGSSSTITKDITVRSDFTPDAQIVSNLVGTGSKTWIVDEPLAGHFGVGPWNASSVTPEWWAGGPFEKSSCCACFYSASYVFSHNAGNNTYSLKTNTPDGAFTKTGALTTLPGIPASGDEGCYPYAGGTSNFSFVPASSGLATSASTSTSIQLAGNSTFIGYGAVLKEYEILSITPTTMYLRVRGTETGNAWYIKLKAQ